MHIPDRSILYAALSAIIVLIDAGCGDTSASLEGSPGMGTVNVERCQRARGQGGKIHCETCLVRARQTSRPRTTRAISQANGPCPLPAEQPPPLFADWGKEQSS